MPNGVSNLRPWKIPRVKKRFNAFEKHSANW